ncbi:deoxyribose-phosphate aldolase [Miltoncostaea oceani]|jgi:deoxyribose-phosphate aldolase|uniref:deoxyribose-phosphate aldolase n=1 Tax=Miltoncostaea oceani TaxID=2843216 RepID=UPI001C3DB83F|nr:deoxyribose-phosphate aldolase [Miltoncostaea oceani]
MRAEDLTKTLDLTVVEPDMTEEDLERFCAAAREHHFAALCTHPRFVPRMAELLKGCDVKSCAVIDFPAGDSTPLERAQQADRAVAEGADEIDVVMNYQAMLRGDFTGVRDDLMRVVRAVRGRAANDARGDVLVKVIIEAPVMNDKVKRLACKIVDDVGADFAKTCTGVTTRATVHDVELLRDALPERVGVNACGGVDTLEAVQAMIGAGAARVGTSQALAVMAELAALNGDAA